MRFNRGVFDTCLMSLVSPERGARRTTYVTARALAFGAGLALLPAISSATPPPTERLFGVPDTLQGQVRGAVFTMTNSADADPGNQVVAFHRLADGTLSLAGYFPTGGVGSGPAPTSTVFGAFVPVPADGLGSQNGLVLSDPDAHGRRLLLAVNAGSDSVTCFVVQGGNDGLLLSAPVTVGSGGVFPNSLAFKGDGSGGVLYVLNAGLDGNVSGFKASAQCTLSPIPHGQQTLAGLISDPPVQEPRPIEVLTSAADIGFTRDGAQLVVSIKGGPDAFAGGVVIFYINPSGSITQPPLVTSFSAAERTAAPFGFDIDDQGRLILTHVGSHTAAAYEIRSSGSLVPIGGPVPVSNLAELGLAAADTPLAFAGFPCWITIHEGIAYVINFGDIPAASGGLPNGPGTIVALRINQDGSLTPLDTDPQAPGLVATLKQDDRNDPKAGLFGNHGLDVAAVADGEGAFLYLAQGRLGTLGAYRIEGDGTLTKVGDFNGGMTPGVDPFAGTNPGINDFLDRCFLQDEPRSPECAQGSIQGVAGY